tara:strand:+ start:7060 stop:7431 length:372 start_codon:yes stop_codon:yes gene_type:complete
MNLETYFADTYALIEMIQGNKNYFKYLEHDFVTSKHNLIELYYQFLRENNRKKANRYLLKLFKYIVAINQDNIKGAMRFKLKYKKEKLSYADCIGWAKAKEIGIKFLTGDQKFEEKENVEFVK